MSFEAQKFLILMKSNVSIFSLVGYAFIPKKSLPNPRSRRFASMFSFKSLIVLILRYSVSFLFVVVVAEGRDCGVV